MKKSATLITTALLTLGFAAASMAADAPKAAGADSSSTATTAKAHKHTAKKHKKAPASAASK
jgi:hypothetical protein